MKPFTVRGTLFWYTVALLFGWFVLGPTLATRRTVHAQDPAPARKAATYATGHVTRPDLARLKRVKHALHGRQLSRLPRATAPAFDCRSLGWVPPIVDQGNCGSCWDFSGTGVATAAFIKAGVGKNDGSFALSEQYTLDCGRNGGCNGDDNTTVLDWAKATGLPLSAVYGSYSARPGRCSLPSGATLYKIAGWSFCDGNGNGVTATQAIKDAMAAYGPVGCAIAADDAFMNVAAGQVFSGNSRSINHDVILVGWDDSKGRSGAWLLRNSWGTGWADNGYCWIEYGANQVGTEAVAAWVTAPPPPPSGTPVITSALSAAGVVGVAFSYQITATNSPVSFDAVGLPAGLTVNTTTGLVSGVPTTAFSGVVAMRATNASGLGSEAVTFTITAAPPVPPPLSNVTITLTADQVQQVIKDSGVIVVEKTMTLQDLVNLLNKTKEKK